MAEVIALLGEPNSRTTLPDGATHLMWLHSTGTAWGTAESPRGRPVLRSPREIHSGGYNEPDADQLILAEQATVRKPMRRFAVLSAVALLGACGDSGTVKRRAGRRGDRRTGRGTQVRRVGPGEGTARSSRPRRRCGLLLGVWRCGLRSIPLPEEAVVNRVYYRQKLTAYERRDGWVRTTQDGFTPRWTRLSQLTDTQPPEKPAYAGPADYADDRIMPDAIPNPGEDGLTRADIDIIRKGAKMVLQTRPDCAQSNLVTRASAGRTPIMLCVRSMARSRTCSSRGLRSRPQR